MGSYAIGIIEVVGLLAAVEAADTCLKSANVKLVGCENADGAFMSVRVCGDVGAVNAAIGGAAAAAARVGEVVSTLVIPRPATGIEPMINNTIISLFEKTPSVQPAAVPEESVKPQEASEGEQAATCNICQDPACPRQKGQSNNLCIQKQIEKNR